MDRTFPRRARRLGWFLALSGLLVAAALPAPIAAGQATVERHPVYGGVEGFFGDCPAELPAEPSTCHETYLLFWRGYDLLGGGSVAPGEAAWYGFVAYLTAEFPGSYQEPTVTEDAFGYGEIEPGYVDTVHLRTASFDDVSLSMSDGSTFTFSGVFIGRGDRWIYGRNGPATGRDFHHVDPCLTFLSIGHQTGRLADFTGTANGEAVSSYEFDSASIFDNSFRYIDVEHASCG